ncbi:MAG: response regulator [Phycisphaerae bacterium]|nr:response regulator transcription factor [Phycisphaerae bacterium]NIP55055.1 response regulator transcription factor [Phycisphaerae bacterium]NIS53765.1 response regulator transcription factor [Phycisphaerae bacterium]NIU11343.1 response regulator transcription factor [Phycisphaerae bacterium]NIU57473.1 response regulator [Phycisphaerae bacterium]
MNYEALNPETAETPNNKKENYKSCEDKTRIMIAGDYPPIRRALVQLISREVELGVCIDAENTNLALDVIKKKLVDLAIIDISSKETNSVRLAETIKLQFLDLPVLILSTNDSAAHAERSSQAEPEENPLGEQVTEQIIRAVRYIQSLLRSKIFGVTILVKTERSGEK